MSLDRTGCFTPVAPRGPVLHYALGGGRGHLVRAVSFLHAFGLADRALLLGSSALLDDRRITSGIATRRVPAALADDHDGLRDWLATCIAQQRPALLCIDCFPAGIRGELCGFPPLDGIPAWHLARLLRWPQYAAMLQGPPPRFDHGFRLEPLHPSHEAFLQAHALRVSDLLLDAAPPGRIDDSAPPAAPFWLVLHGGPRDEVEQLLACAVDMRRVESADVDIVVISGAPPLSLPARCTALDVHPATAWVQAAARIFSAAGFNVIAETRAHRARQFVLPMPRRFDDQHQRARRARSEAPARP